MAKYLVRCKASVYYDVEVEAEDEWFAEELGLSKLGELTETAVLPEPLSWDNYESWEIQELEGEDAELV